MRIKIIDNEGLELFITKDREYDVLTKYRKGVGVMCDNGHEFPIYEKRYIITVEDVEEPKPITKPKEEIRRVEPKQKPKKLTLFEQVMGGKK